MLLNNNVKLSSLGVSVSLIMSAKPPWWPLAAKNMLNYAELLCLKNHRLSRAAGS